MRFTSKREFLESVEKEHQAFVELLRSAIVTATKALMKIERPRGFTPKAFANCSPGLPQLCDQILNKKLNSERVRKRVRARFANTFGVYIDRVFRPRVEATLAAISERLRRKTARSLQPSQLSINNLRKLG